MLLPVLFSACAAMAAAVTMRLLLWSIGFGSAGTVSSPSSSSSFASSSSSSSASAPAIDVSWHQPPPSDISNLTAVINGTGTFGFIFNSSSLPAGVPYGTYNWCNMPHVRRDTYPAVGNASHPASMYHLEYVEVIQRHHKRTPYAANTFPAEDVSWECSDAALYQYGAPIPTAAGGTAAAGGPAHGRLAALQSTANPLAPRGFNGSCRFPQITGDGLEDSRTHGADLAGVYGHKGLLGFLPAEWDAERVAFRVTNNPITAQVAGMVLAGLFPETSGRDVPLLVEREGIDALEPDYGCATADAVYTAFTAGSGSRSGDDNDNNDDDTDLAWRAHLAAAAPLYAALDAVSGIDPSDSGWHDSVDHYFDELSARLCHAKALPCSLDRDADEVDANSEKSHCVSQAQADEVFRLGEWEYAYKYRGAGRRTLDAAVASFGIWAAQLARNLRVAAGLHASGTEDRTAAGQGVTGRSADVRYRHNVAHDGSVARLLALLQIDAMVWPGMGAEVVFELYSEAERAKTKDNEEKNKEKEEKNNSNKEKEEEEKKDKEKENDDEDEGKGGRRFYIRVLWGGRILQSNSPTLGRMDMLPVETLLAYIDALVGVDAAKVYGISCNITLMECPWILAPYV